jgi:archaellum component FlaG (FlaF/FlaG flagellin family)
MASDDSVTQMIFFVASVLVAVSIAGTIMAISGLMADEMKTKANGAVSEMGSSIVFANDPRHVPYEDGVLTLYIKNTGETVQSYNSLILFIDGQYVEFDADLLGPGNLWVTGGMIEITVTIVLGEGDHTAKAILSNGVSDTLDFRL